MSYGYCLRCRRCGKCIFCTSLKEGKQQLKEHWEAKHWRSDIAPFEGIEYIYEGRIKKPSGAKAIYKTRKVKQFLPTSEYEIDIFRDDDWALIKDSIGTPEFNRALYQS